MTKITFHDKPLETKINLPAVGTNAPNFTLVASDLSEKSLSDYQGKKLILNIFPSIDTPTCATSVKRFNQQAAALDNVEVLCISVDLPFAQSRFCGAENADKVTTLSAFRSTFGKDYGVVFTDSPLKGLLARCVIVLDETGKVTYSEVVSEVTNEPDYKSALAAI